MATSSHHYINNQKYFKSIYIYMDYKKKYIKYKEKYLKLKQVGGISKNNFITDNTDIITKIDDIYFMIICKHKQKDREIFLLKTSLINDFTNENNYKLISFYRSSSELKFLRLGIYFNDDNQYYKGKYHYIQQTFIDIRLQTFINKKIDSIPINKNFTMEKEEDFEIIMEHIDNSNRKIEISHFEQKTDYCLRVGDPDDIINEMKKLSIKLKEVYNYNKPNYHYSYVKNGYYSYNVYSIELIPKTTTEETLMLYYMIADFCKYDDTKNFIIDAIDINISRFQNLAIGKQCKYTDFYLPVFLTTKDSKITEYGTYSKYVLAVNYICKFLNYHEYCSKLEYPLNKCSANYSIIADRYIDIFPFNELADTNLIKYIKEEKLTDENIILELNSINIPNSNTGMNPLLYAIINDKIDYVNILVNNGADLNYYNIYNNKSILIYAIEYNRVNIFNFLLTNGANSNIPNSSTGMTPFKYAIINDKIDYVKILVNKKADVNYYNIYDQKSVLLYAIEYNRDNIFDFLLKNGANINNTCDGTCYSQLMIAIKNNFTYEQIEKIIKHTDNINYVYNYNSALTLAIKDEKNASVIDLLVKNNVDIKNKEDSRYFAIPRSVVSSIVSIYANYYKTDLKLKEVITNLLEKIDEKDILILLIGLSQGNNKENIINEILLEYMNKKKITFNLLDDSLDYLSNYCSGINIYHLYKLYKTLNLSLGNIKKLYISCKIKERTLKIRVINRNNYLEFIEWINENKFYINEIKFYDYNKEMKLPLPNETIRAIYNDEYDSDDSGAFFEFYDDI